MTESGKGKRDRRWGGPACPRVERPGSDNQWAEWVKEKRNDQWSLCDGISVGNSTDIGSTGGATIQAGEMMTTDGDPMFDGIVKGSQAWHQHLQDIAHESAGEDTDSDNDSETDK